MGGWAWWQKGNRLKKRCSFFSWEILSTIKFWKCKSDCRYILLPLCRLPNFLAGYPGSSARYPGGARAVWEKKSVFNFWPHIFLVFFPSPPSLSFLKPSLPWDLETPLFHRGNATFRGWGAAMGLKGVALQRKMRNFLTKRCAEIGQQSSAKFRRDGTTNITTVTDICATIPDSCTTAANLARHFGQLCTIYASWSNSSPKKQQCDNLLRRVKSTLGPTLLKSVAIHLPFLPGCFCKSMPFSWQKVRYTPHQFVSRYHCHHKHYRPEKNLSELFPAIHDRIITGEYAKRINLIVIRAHYRKHLAVHRSHDTRTEIPWTKSCNE